MGERHVRNVEAAGSIPAISTKLFDSRDNKGLGEGSYSVLLVMFYQEGLIQYQYIRQGMKKSPPRRSLHLRHRAF